MSLSVDTADPNISTKQHVPVLDGVRARAVLSVVCFHFSQAFTHTPHTLIARLAVWGQTGVDLFFVLSAFLITGILLDASGRQYFLRTFYARRILRIFPPYYVPLFVVYFVSPPL